MNSNFVSEDRHLLESNSAYHLLKYTHEACFKKCEQKQLTNSSFLSVNETKCIRNCMTKTNASYLTVIDNLGNAPV